MGRFGVSFERRSTHNAVTDALREAILSGRILPGTPLREIPLSEELGVSRNTVREASRVLAAEGLVRHQMNHGVIVTELSDHEIDELYEARGVLEAAGVTALLAAGPDAPAWARLASLVEHIERGLGRADVAAVLAGDRDFHAVLVEATGNARLTAWHAAVQQELRLALNLAERSTRELGRAGDDHRVLLDALRGGDHEHAQRELREHLGAGAAELHRLRKLVQQRRDQ
ncbi:GntR family transcriptional regulator [Pseudonocardia acaciae]|uniref:GntR family transcriptional regulator n=1 Tax=Pseudonocardia acaciae TaxID=551276 RepID=UPI0006889813|nr:GntR family transcriptional regulator [Pseudonocardia acaciae]